MRRGRRGPNRVVEDWRNVICDAIHCDKECKQIDVSMAFTFGFPDRETLLQLPPGYRPREAGGVGSFTGARGKATVSSPGYGGPTQISGVTMRALRLA